MVGEVLRLTSDETLGRGGLSNIGIEPASHVDSTINDPELCVADRRADAARGLLERGPRLADAITRGANSFPDRAADLAQPADGPTREGADLGADRAAELTDPAKGRPTDLAEAAGEGAEALAEELQDGDGGDRDQGDPSDGRIDVLAGGRVRSREEHVAEDEGGSDRVEGDRELEDAGRVVDHGLDEAA